MKTIISLIQAFISQALAVAMLATGVCLFAGEVRLAALRKATQGSSKLSEFTERMTKTKVNQITR